MSADEDHETSNQRRMHGKKCIHVSFDDYSDKNRLGLVWNLAANDVYLSLPALSFLSSHGDDNRINRMLERIERSKDFLNKNSQMEDKRQRNARMCESGAAVKPSGF